MNKDHIHVFDMSERLHIDATFDVLKEIGKLRDLSFYSVGNPDVLLNPYIEKNFNPKRNQLHSRGLIKDIVKTGFHNDFKRDGKIIIVDEDLYDDGLNWCFGGFMGTRIGIGYILLSTSRLQNDYHARDLIRHEIGHMFGAPSDNRACELNGNVYEHLGLHCSNDLCVMQQKDRVDFSVKYAIKRARLNADTYCSQCTNDIRNYEVSE